MPSEKKKTYNYVLLAAIVLIVAGASFFGGILFQKSQTRSTFAQFANGQNRFMRNGMMGQNGNRGFGGAVVGEIAAIDNDSLTIKLPDGSSKIINLSQSTTFSKTETGSKNDLKTGIRVAAIGTTNSDGSITAQNIQINPMFRTGRISPTITK